MLEIACRHVDLLPHATVPLEADPLEAGAAIGLAAKAEFTMPAIDVDAHRHSVADLPIGNAVAYAANDACKLMPRDQRQ